jgi:hypothetical protein
MSADDPKFDPVFSVWPERGGPYPFEVERDRIVKLFEDAADRLEQMAAGSSAEEFWLCDIENAVSTGILSGAGVMWAKVMGPVVAPVLVAELRKSAQCVASACMGAEVSLFSENMAGLAERILAVNP